MHTHTHARTHTHTRRSLAQTMRLVSDPRDLLQNPHRLLLNISLLRQTLSSLSPNASIIFIGTQKYNSLAPPDQPKAYIPWPQLNETEPIYNTSYAVISMPQKALDYWESSESASLWLPKRNGFVPVDFSMVPMNGSSQVPQLVDLSGGTCMFVRRYMYVCVGLCVWGGCVCVCVGGCGCVCVGVCVWGGGGGGCVCGCVCVCPCVSVCVCVHVYVQISGEWKGIWNRDGPL